MSQSDIKLVVFNPDPLSVVPAPNPACQLGRPVGSVVPPPSSSATDVASSPTFAPFDLGPILPSDFLSDLDPVPVDCSDLTPDDLDAADEGGGVPSRFVAGSDPQVFAHLPRDTWVVFPPSPKVSYELFMLPHWNTSQSGKSRSPDAFLFIPPKAREAYKSKPKNRVLAVPFYVVGSRSLNFYLIAKLEGAPSWVSRSAMLEAFYGTPNQQVRYVHQRRPPWEFSAFDTPALDWNFNTKDVLFRALVSQRLVRG